MHISRTLRVRSLLTAVACAFVASCGGSGDDSSSAGPSALFPRGVRSGTLSIHASTMLELHIVFAGTDETQGSTYTGSLTLPVDDAAAEGALGAETHTVTLNGVNFRLAPETTAGRLVFYFDTIAAYQALEGRLVLLVPHEQVFDERHYRTGSVEGSTDVRFMSTSGAETKLPLADSSITISWNAAADDKEQQQDN